MGQSYWLIAKKKVGCARHSQLIKHENVNSVKCETGQSKKQFFVISSWKPRVNQHRYKLVAWCKNPKVFGAASKQYTYTYRVLRQKQGL
jgi:hypothetical protein